MNPLQDLLALEQESVWWYGQAVGQDPASAALAAARRDHLAKRDTLASELAGRHMGTPAPQPTYGTSSAVALESRLVAAHLALLGWLPTSDGFRRTSVTWLTQAAVAARAFGAELDAFPGLS